MISKRKDRFLFMYIHKSSQKSVTMWQLELRAYIPFNRERGWGEGHLQENK